MKNLKYLNKKNIFFVFFSFVLFCFIFGCSKSSETELSLKTRTKTNLDSENIWEQKIRFLSETNSPNFSNTQNLKPKYILEVCQYYKVLSDSNIEYDNKIKKYIISEIEVKEIIKNLLGIEEFKFEDKDFYDKQNGLYFFDDYISFFDNKTYENKEIIVLDDQRIKFKLNVINNKTNLKYCESYILKKDDKNNYYIVSKETS